MIRKPLRALLILALSLTQLNAAEYFVAKQGDDKNSGLAPGEAFGTIQKGVDALAPGDTLTIMPGEYFGNVRRDKLGSADKETLIRARVPGTVVLRGDVRVPAFRRLDGARLTWVTDIDLPAEAQAVNGTDTRTIFERMPNVTELEYVPGKFYHDIEAKKLYLSTSDMRPAGEHRYTASVIPTHGFYLSNATRVTIEGLAVTGFHLAGEAPRHDFTEYSTWGMFIAEGKDCVIRNCRAWLNGQGIGTRSRLPTSGDNVIEGCAAWSNFSQFGTGDRGGLTLFEPRRDVIRDSVSVLNGDYGINIRGGGKEGLKEENKSRLLRNLAWGNGKADIKIKTGYGHVHVTERCVGMKPSNHLNPRHCLFGRDARGTEKDTIILTAEKDLDPRAEFADPENHDYRLQATSRFRGAAPDGSDRGPFPYKPNIFYLRPDGNDEADGLSVGHAWKTLGRAVKALRPGDTLYLSSGSYQGGVEADLRGEADSPISIRGRGREEVVIRGGWPVTDSRHVEFVRLRFDAPFSVTEDSHIAFRSCRFPGGDAREAEPWDTPRHMPAPTKMRLARGLEVHSVSATTANLEWTTSLPAVCELAWGDTPECVNKDTFEVDHFGSYSLTKLTPGRTYWFRVLSLRPAHDLRGNPVVDGARSVVLEGGPISFTSLEEDPAPRTLYVAPNGDDASTGLDRDHAWRTLQHAANKVRPGDTVLIAAGTYKERVRMRATGAPGAPITFKCLPGEKVILSGDRKKLNKAFISTGKRHLRFDGMYFVESNRELLQGWILRYAGDFSLYKCGDIRISRCFSDGRGGYSARFVTAWHVADLSIENCVILNKMSGGMALMQCPNLRVEHTVFGRPLISAFMLRNDKDQPAVMNHNIITDMLHKKAVLNINLLTVDHRLRCPQMRNNCFFLRCFPPEVRHIVGRSTALDLKDYIVDPLFADPRFAGDPSKEDQFGPDAMMNPRLDLDFDSFFATNPEVLKWDIGLQPRAFQDFRFSAGTRNR